MGRENTRCTFFIRQSSRFRRQPANTSRRPSFHTSHTILRQPTSFLPSWPADALHISNLHIQPHHLNFLLPFFYRQHPSGYFHHSSIFPFPIFNSNFLPSPISNSTSSVLLPLLQPAGQTRNVASRAGAACKAADGAGEEPAFLFFLSFFIFFCFSLFSLLSHLTGGFAATPSFFFLFFLFIFFFLFAFVLIFVLIFVFLFLLFFLLFLFVFFLSIFILIFYSCFFVLSFCFFFLFTFALIFVFLFFIFIFTFIFAFFVFSLCFFFLVFIFDSPFIFCLSFCFTFLPSSLQSLSSLSNRSPAIHFFSSAANLSHSIQPLQQQQKEEKISAKESTGVRWPPGSERAAGGKAEGRNGMK